MSDVPATAVNPATLPVPPDGVIKGSFNFQDPNGLPINYVITHEPTLGQAVIAADGSWTYTPTQAARLAAALAAPGTETRDSFSVDASDADGEVGGSGEMLTVAPATVTLTKQIPVAGAEQAFAVALSSDGKRIFIGNYTGDDVVIAHTDDGSSQTVALTAAGNVGSVALGPMDRMLYVTQAGMTEAVLSHVTAVDTATPATQTQLLETQDFLTLMAVSTDGKSVYVGDQPGAKVVVIDTVSNTTQTIPLGPSPANQPFDMAVGPNHTLWVASTGQGEAGLGVIVVDTVTGAATPINDVVSFRDARAPRIVASPDGSRMYICQNDGSTSGAGHVSVINTATYDNHAYGLQGDPISAAVSTDGSVLYVLSAQPSGNTVLHLVDTKTDKVITTLTTTGERACTPLISPDGVHIYVVQAGDSANVEVYTLAGTGKWSA
jgi:YVTN family beta-propeller protein/VCBS repeat-containing protein